MRRLLFRCFLGVAFVAPAFLTLAADEASESEARLTADVKYLASDELEGRGVGTAGLDKAADYIAEHFRKAGLKTELVERAPYQAFRMSVGASLGQPNELVLRGPGDRRIALKVGADFTPLAIGADGELAGDIVFAGYGIEAAPEGYNDYAGIDASGKIVLVMRREPQQTNPHSVFRGTDDSRYASLVMKASTAYQKGAKAILFVTEPHSARTARQAQQAAREHELDRLFAEGVKQLTDQPEAEAATKFAETLKAFGDSTASEAEKLLDYRYAGVHATHSLPLIQISQHTANEMLMESLGTTLVGRETTIDVTMKPHSAALTGWRLEGRITFDRQQSEVKNVIAVLEGEGPLAAETIVVGAHYDHLGYGDVGSLAGKQGQIHNGADDNASGTAAIMELARRLAARKERLPRTVMFAAFTAEEMGLIGSAHYVRNPVVPLDRTVAMVNLDMVGRLTNDRVVVAATAETLDTVVEDITKKHGLNPVRDFDAFERSDHYSFYARNIPVVFFFTNAHADYHRPSDDWDKVNYAGMRRIVDVVEETVVHLATAEARPKFTEVAATSAPRGGGSRPYFGSIPDFGREVEGYALQDVGPGSPAQKAGLKGGDVIIRLGERKIGGLQDFDAALRAFKPGDRVKVAFLREGKEETTDIVLGSPR